MVLTSPEVWLLKATARTIKQMHKVTRTFMDLILCHSKKYNEIKDNDAILYYFKSKYLFG